MDFITFMLIMVVISVILIVPTPKFKKKHAVTKAVMRVNRDEDDFGTPDIVYEEEFDRSKLTLSRK